MMRRFADEPGAAFSAVMASFRRGADRFRAACLFGKVQ